MAKNTGSIPTKSTGSIYTAAEFEILRGFVDAPSQNSINFTANFIADGQKKFNDYTLSGDETWNASALQKGNRLWFDLITPGGFTITKGTNIDNDFNGLFGSVLAAGTYRIYMTVISSSEIDVEVPGIGGNFFNKTTDDSDDIVESTNKKFLDGSSEQLITGNKEFSGQAHANNAAGVVISFSATPTFDFDNGNDQEMPVTGNVTTFATSNEAGSANYKVWLITDASVRTVVAPTGWTKAASSDDHDTAANSINLYQFFTRPGGTKYYSILNI